MLSLCAWILHSSLNNPTETRRELPSNGQVQGLDWIIGKYWKSAASATLETICLNSFRWIISSFQKRLPTSSKTQPFFGAWASLFRPSVLLKTTEYANWKRLLVSVIAHTLHVCARRVPGRVYWHMYTRLELQRWELIWLSWSRDTQAFPGEMSGRDGEFSSTSDPFTQCSFPGESMSLRPNQTPRSLVTEHRRDEVSGCISLHSHQNSLHQSSRFRLVFTPVEQRGPSEETSFGSNQN